MSSDSNKVVTFDSSYVFFPLVQVGPLWVEMPQYRVSRGRMGRREDRPGILTDTFGRKLCISWFWQKIKCLFSCMRCFVGLLTETFLQPTPACLL